MKHEYTSNKSQRKTVITVITIISLLLNCVLAPVVNAILDKLSENITPYLYPFIILLGVGFSLFFGGLYLLFDIVLWKVIPGMRVQNLGGIYECKGVSSRAHRSWEGTIKITQTWSKIYISLQTVSSTSKSFMANLHVDDNGSVILYYCYRNEPNGSIEKLKKHEGTAEIIFDGNLISGKYYNYPLDRQNFGTLTLNKQEKTK